MGECLDVGAFEVVDFTVDRGGGTVATFIRSLRGALRALGEFFERTGHDYRRYNYLGEWHSHPSFEPLPSSRDIESAQSIADDAAVGANFVALVIVKLDAPGQIQGTATVFRPGQQCEAAMLVVEEGHERI